LTKVDAGDFKHELLNRLRSTMAVNVLSQNQGTNKQIPEYESESLAHLLSFHE